MIELYFANLSLPNLDILTAYVELGEHEAEESDHHAQKSHRDHFFQRAQLSLKDNTCQ